MGKQAGDKAGGGRVRQLSMQVGRQDIQAGRHTDGKASEQVSRQASFEPAEGRLQKLVHYKV